MESIQADTVKEDHQAEPSGWMVANVRTGEFWLNAPRGQWTTKDKATVFEAVVSGPLPIQACWVRSDFEFTQAEQNEFRTRALSRRRAGGEEIYSRIGLQYRSGTLPGTAEAGTLHRVIGDLGDGLCLVQNSLKVACHVPTGDIDQIATYPTHDYLVRKMRAGDAQLAVDKTHHEEFVWAGLRYFCGWDANKNPNFNPHLCAKENTPECDLGTPDACPRANAAAGCQGNPRADGKSKIGCGSPDCFKAMDKIVGWVVYKAETQPLEA